LADGQIAAVDFQRCVGVDAVIAGGQQDCTAIERETAIGMDRIIR